MKNNWEYTSRQVPKSLFDAEIILQKPGIVIIKFSGPKAKELFSGECGGIRWQRVPPTEKKDRIHTSTITVAVLDEKQDVNVIIDPKDLEESFIRGSGNGGQARNKTSNAVQLIHLPTGIVIKAESERSQKQNRVNAMQLLLAKLTQLENNKNNSARVKERKEQVGSGQRGDKFRTIQEKYDSVVDHNTGKKISFRDYSRGNLWGLKS